MVNYACTFSQSELGKYFEWIIILIIIKSQLLGSIYKDDSPFISSLRMLLVEDLVTPRRTEPLPLLPVLQ